MVGHKPEVLRVEALFPVVEKVFANHPNAIRERANAVHKQAIATSIPTPMTRKAVEDATNNAYTTVFLRFPHLWEHLLGCVPFREKFKAKVGIIGPGVIFPECYEMQVPGLESTLMIPQVSESAMIFSQAQITVIERAGKVWDQIEKLKGESKFLGYPHNWASAVLQKNRFKPEAKGYPHLTELMKTGPKERSIGKEEYQKLDISQSPLKKKFGFIIATKIFCHIAYERPDLPLSSLHNALAGLQKKGRFYIDEESLRDVADKVNATIPDLLQMLGKQMNTQLKAVLIPHHVINEEDGLFFIVHRISELILMKAPTDNIYEIQSL